MTDRIAAELGAAIGFTLVIAIDWNHIIEKSVETAIIGLIGGLMGALGGLVGRWFFKKYIHKEESNGNSSKKV